MLRAITFSILFLLFLPFSNSQVVVSYELMDEYTKEELQDILTNDFQIPSILLPMYNDIEVFKVTYNTPDGTGQNMTTATGAVAYPKGYMCNLPIACYEHGTTATKTGVPSYGSSELTIGLLWAGRGFVSVLPDYLGLGDSPGMHPYVHAKSEATASIDMIRAAKEIGDQLGYFIGEDLFIFGYSQGGHAAMATFKEIQEFHSDEMTVSACIGMSGPYDVAGVQTDFINSGQPYATPGYLPYVFLGYQSVYGNLYNNSLSEVLLPPYDTTLPPLFDGTHGMGTINAACTPIPTDMIVPAYQADFESNPNHPFRIALEDNTLIHWTPQSPVRMLYCDQDEQVYYRNSEVARDSFVARGAPDVFARNFGAYDHAGCVQFCLFSAISTMDTFRTGPNILLDYAIAEEESSAGAMDGKIDLFPNVDADPLTYVWSTGDTSEDLNGVGPGDYTVTITEGTGCTASFTFNFDQLLSNETPKVQELEIFPNPTTGILNLELGRSSNYQLNLISIDGKTLIDDRFTAGGVYEVDLSNFNKGIYFVQLTNLDNGLQYLSKVMKE